MDCAPTKRKIPAANRNNKKKMNSTVLDVQEVCSAGEAEHPVKKEVEVKIPRPRGRPRKYPKPTPTTVVIPSTIVATTASTITPINTPTTPITASSKDPKLKGGYDKKNISTKLTNLNISVDENDALSDDDLGMSLSSAQQLAASMQDHAHNRDYDIIVISDEDDDDEENGHAVNREINGQQIEYTFGVDASNPSYTASTSTTTSYVAPSDVIVVVDSFSPSSPAESLSSVGSASTTTSRHSRYRNQPIATHHHQHQQHNQHTVATTPTSSSAVSSPSQPQQAGECKTPVASKEPPSGQQTDNRPPSSGGASFLNIAEGTSMPSYSPNIAIPATRPPPSGSSFPLELGGLFLGRDPFSFASSGSQQHQHGSTAYATNLPYPASYTSSTISGSLASASSGSLYNSPVNSPHNNLMGVEAAMRDARMGDRHAEDMKTRDATTVDVRMEEEKTVSIKVEKINEDDCVFKANATASYDPLYNSNANNNNDCNSSQTIASLNPSSKPTDPNTPLQYHPNPPQSPVNTHPVSTGEEDHKQKVYDEKIDQQLEEISPSVNAGPLAYPSTGDNDRQSTTDLDVAMSTSVSTATQSGANTQCTPRNVGVECNKKLQVKVNSIDSGVNVDMESDKVGKVVGKVENQKPEAKIATSSPSKYEEPKTIDCEMKEETSVMYSPNEEICGLDFNLKHIENLPCSIESMSNDEMNEWKMLATQRLRGLATFRSL